MKLQDLIQLNESVPYAPWMFKTKEEVQRWIDGRGELGSSATLNPDLTIDIDGGGGVYLVQTALTENKIPVRFNHIEGDFTCSNIALKSLIGSPRRVEGQVFCSQNILASFKGSPDFIGGNFTCHSNLFTSFEGFPKQVNGGCYNHNNPSIKDLHNIHKQVKYIGKFFNVPGSVRSAILGLMFIKGIRFTSVYNRHTVQSNDLINALDIINKHLAGNRDPHECQEELIDAGLKEYAKL